MAKARFSELFHRQLDALVVVGQLTLVRGVALETCIAEIEASPSLHDETVQIGDTFHWIRACRAPDGQHTGLCVAYTPSDDETVRFEGVFVRT